MQLNIVSVYFYSYFNSYSMLKLLSLQTFSVLLFFIVSRAMLLRSRSCLRPSAFRLTGPFLQASPDFTRAGGISCIIVHESSISCSLTDLNMVLGVTMSTSYITSKNGWPEATLQTMTRCIVCLKMERPEHPRSSN